uniref:Uncharacterized protein n=1 Tax=Rhipicephalus zambeziensis TaxID=60191 RepID=A0A224YEP9_9ACAR
MPDYKCPSLLGAKVEKYGMKSSREDHSACFGNWQANLHLCSYHHLKRQSGTASHTGTSPYTYRTHTFTKLDSGKNTIGRYAGSPRKTHSPLQTVVSMIWNCNGHSLTVLSNARLNV